MKKPPVRSEAMKAYCSPPTVPTTTDSVSGPLLSERLSTKTSSYVVPSISALNQSGILAAVICSNSSP